MRCLRFVFATLCCLFALFSFASTAFAQYPAVYPSISQSIPSTTTSSDALGIGTWSINGVSKGNSTFVYGPTPAGGTDNTGGWKVTVVQKGGSFTIIPPAGATLGSYTITYGTSSTGNAKDDTLLYYGPAANFNVVSPAPKPVAGSPAYSWQGSVGGVNTGNGNKTTTLPITGWTMRGGMGVSCTLYHNSEASNSYATWGNKWTPSYYSYISGGSSAPTLYWDNGLVEVFQLHTTVNGVSTYYSPYGILDTLTCAGGIFTLTTTSQTVYTFGFVSGNAYLSSITDMDGNTLAINHGNGDTTISNVVDPTNRSYAYTYSGGKMVSVEDPLARVWNFTYGAAGGNSTSNLWYVTLPALAGDPNTHSLYFGYDNNSNIIAQESAQGHTATFGYNLTAAPGSYNANSLAWAKDPIGNETTFNYNPNSDPTSTTITDPNGFTTKHTYQYGRLITVTDAKSYPASTVYDYNNIVTSMVDKNGNTWTYSSHFSNGTTTANGSSTSTSYEPLSPDKIPRSTSTTYDAKNKVTQSVDASGNVTANTYSTDGKEDLTGTSVTGTGSNPFHSSSSISGYTNGLPTTFTDAYSYQSSVGYDGNGYVNSTLDANSNTGSAIYNVLGWKTSSTDANGHVTTYAHDNWGRLTDTYAPDGTDTNIVYDYDGDVTQVQDANGHTVKNYYDADDRLYKTQNGRGDIVQYTYDGPSGYGSADLNGQTQLGLLSSKTDGNQHTTTYTYTQRNEPFQSIYPDGNGESAFYDKNGNLYQRQKSDGSYITYTYDYGNRLTNIKYTHLAATSFSYDADGRKTQMIDASGTTKWTYGDGVNLTQQTTPQGTVGYGYDNDGRRSIMSLAGTGSWYYSYDNGGRLTKLQSPTDGTTTLTYDGVGGRGNKDAAGLTQYGLLSTKTEGNGNYELYDYDQCNEKTSIGYWWDDGTEQNSLVYGYDLAGNVKTVNQGFYSTTYGYDGADQLMTETSTNGSAGAPPTLGYTYDSNGNRKTQTQNGTQVQGFSYDAHDKLTSGTTGSETPGYDAMGNETSNTIYGSTYHFVYDDEDRLTSLTTPGNITDTFTYNGLGLRVTKTDSTGSYAYVCDGTSPGSPVLTDGVALYTPGLSENRGGASCYYSNDLLGNLWTLDASSKSQLSYQDTTGFGTNTATSGAPLTPFGYGGGNGCQTDADTGLILMGHRYYDTRIGRFITQDPAKSGGNWYAYAGNNPTSKTDPSGLQIPDGPGASLSGSPGAMANGNGGNGYGEDDSESYENNQQVASNPPSALDGLKHYLGKTGTPLSINVTNLPYPEFNIFTNPSVQRALDFDNNPFNYPNGNMLLPISFPVDANVDLNFGDLLVGRAEGHFIGTVTIIGGDGSYAVNGKMFVYPDTWKLDNQPARGFGLNALTNAGNGIANMLGGGKNFTTNVTGYIPVHYQNGGASY